MRLQTTPMVSIVGALVGWAALVLLLLLIAAAKLVPSQAQ